MYFAHEFQEQNIEDGWTAERVRSEAVSVLASERSVSPSEANESRQRSRTYKVQYICLVCLLHVVGPAVLYNIYYNFCCWFSKGVCHMCLWIFITNDSLFLPSVPLMPLKNRLVDNYWHCYNCLMGEWVKALYNRNVFPVCYIVLHGDIANFCYSIC